MFIQHKRSSRSSGILALATCSAIAMCSALATAPASPATGFPTGTYAAGGHTTLTFDGNGQLHVSKGDVTEVVVDYTVSGDEIQLTDESGPWACTKANEKAGTYRWKYRNGVLAFSKVRDRCVPRVASLTNYTWKHRK
ncbi:MAG TPA: hypothetical protein VGN43_20515 [Steroidobacteraceae bacterium]|jgi:ABC-type transport system substrate-binding protein|nr:hypothetical protein [Steroidobacteraceae bacterium]